MQTFHFFNSVIPSVYYNHMMGNRCYCSHVSLPRRDKFTSFSLSKYTVQDWNVQ